MLIPYAANPSTAASNIYRTDPGVFPKTEARISAPDPEPHPLRMTICIGLLPESFLVKLFSSPHTTQARTTRSEPGDKLTAVRSPTESMIDAREIRAIAIQSLFPTA